MHIGSHSVKRENEYGKQNWGGEKYVIRCRRIVRNALKLKVKILQKYTGKLAWSLLYYYAMLHVNGSTQLSKMTNKEVKTS